MPASIESSALDALRRKLVSAIVHVPGSEGYEESIVRWSDTGMRHAVCEMDPVWYARYADEFRAS